MCCGSNPFFSAYTDFSLIDPSIIGIRLMCPTSFVGKKAKCSLTACNAEKRALLRRAFRTNLIVNHDELGIGSNHSDPNLTNFLSQIAAFECVMQDIHLAICIAGNRHREGCLDELICCASDRVKVCAISNRNAVAVATTRSSDAVTINRRIAVLRAAHIKYANGSPIFDFVVTEQRLEIHGGYDINNTITIIWDDYCCCRRLTSKPH